MLQPRLSAAFDPLSRKTRLSSDLPNHLCFALELPLEWQATSDGNARFAAPALGAELEIALRSADELPRLAQPDLASRDATVLLDAHEQALGRPAQAVSLTPLSLAGASRWTATWSDPNLPTPSGSLTVETFIVVLDKDWLAELTISNVEARGIYEWLVQEMLSGFEARSAETCGRRE